VNYSSLQQHIYHKHLLDILRSNRVDDMGIRGLLPALYLRLGQDSACYDYLKWWALHGKDSDSDLENTELPYLDIKDADPFESLDGFNIEYFNVTLRNMLLLLKWRLLCDVQGLDKARCVASGEQLVKLLDNIRSHMLSSATKKNAALMEDVDEGEDLSAYINELESQVNTLLKSESRRNKDHWEPGSQLSTTEEMDYMSSQTWDAWNETPGAFAWIRSRQA
jgi:hypothetical protein